MAHRPPPIHGPMDSPACRPIHRLEVEPEVRRRTAMDRTSQNEAKRMIEARKRYYHTWASKPGNLERKAAEFREITALKRSLGVCTHCKNDATPGRALCETCAMISRERKALARNLKREQKCMLNKYTLAEMP